MVIGAQGLQNWGVEPGHGVLIKSCLREFLVLFRVWVPGALGSDSPHLAGHQQGTQLVHPASPMPGMPVSRDVPGVPPGAKQNPCSCHTS